MAVAFEDFLRDFKNFTGFEKAYAADAEKVLREVDSGIKSVDDAIKSMSVTQLDDGFLRIADQPAGAINKILREGNLEDLVKASKQDIAITSRDKALYSELVKATPEKSIYAVSEETATNASKYPQLDVTADNISSLSVAGERDLKKAESNLFKKFKEGTILALTIGTVVVSVDAIRKATERRKGCFMLTTINGKTTSCKVQAYSCIGNNDGVLCNSSLPYYNLTLVLMQIANLPDTDQRKIDVATAAGVAPADLHANMKLVIDTKYTEIGRVISKMDNRPLFQICNLTHKDVEKGVVPPCRMCSPSDNPTSTSFIDPTQYPENVTFHCSINPSIVETMSDIVINTGVDIWDGITTGILKFLKPIGIFLAVILVLAIILIVLFKYVPSRRSVDYVQQTTV